MAGMGNKLSDLRLNLPGSDRKIQKRLIFDRRYGWVYFISLSLALSFFKTLTLPIIYRFDEWKDPAEEALAGGRGMFCVVPIAKGLLRMASQSINRAVESVTKVLESSGQISPPALNATLINQCQKLMDFTWARNVNLPPSVHLSVTHVKSSS